MEFPELSNRLMAHGIPNLGRKKLEGDGFFYCSDIMAMSGRSRRQSIRILQKLDRAEKYDGVHYRIKDTPITRDFFTKYRKHMRRVRAVGNGAGSNQFDQDDPAAQVINLIRRQGRSARGVPPIIQTAVVNFNLWKRFVLDNNSPDYWTIDQIEEFFVQIKPISDFVTKIIEREAALKKNTAGQSPGLPSPHSDV